MNTTNMVPPIQQQPDGDGSTDGEGDNNFRIGKAKTLTPSRIPKSRSAADQSTHNIESTLFSPSADNVNVTTTSPLELVEEVAYSSPTPFDIDNGNNDYEEDNSLTSPLLLKADSTPQDRLEDDDMSNNEEAVTTGDNRLSSSPLPDDQDDFQENANDSNTERQPHRRDPSIQTQESDVKKRCLPEDTFSFLIYCPIRSWAFFLATLVFAFQIAIYLVLASDVTNLSSKYNMLKFPVNVEMPVRIAEFLAGVVAIITQDDVRKALILLRDGFDEDLVEAFPGATKAKWILSVALRTFEGLFGLFLTFLLIMQSTTVLDLLLNFLAMQFVGELDDVVFVLAKQGFFGRYLQEASTCWKWLVTCWDWFVNVTNAGSVYLVMKESMTRIIYNSPCWGCFVTCWDLLVTHAGPVYFTIIFGIFIFVWVWIGRKQRVGDYLCHTIFAQYGHEALPMLGTFSGLFFQHNKAFDGRLSYRDSYRYDNKYDQVGGPLLAYCTNEKRWTLSLTKDGVSPDNWNPCDWYAASSESQDFDVLTTASSQWVVRTPTGVVPLSRHFMACQDCFFSTDDFCGDSGTCSQVRWPPEEYDQCLCEQGHYGLRCEYQPCQCLETKQHFLKEDGSNFASKYHRLEGAEAYKRPIYTSLGDDQTLSNDTDFIVFTGARWILSYKSLFPGLKDVNDTSGLVRYFSQFHGYSTKYVASYVSEPVYIDGPVDDTASPEGLRWLYPIASDNAFDQPLQPDLQKGFIKTKFFCAECNDEIDNGCPRVGGYVNVLVLVTALMNFRVFNT